MNRHQIDEKLRQRHRKAWCEARARWSPAREAGPGQWCRRGSGKVGPVEVRRRQESPPLTEPGCHATAFGSWSGGHSISPVFRAEPSENRLTVFKGQIITPGRPPRWWAVEQGV